MANCPANATDCLLRAIVDNQNDFNWDPPTFGVTIAIGILALLVSISTVFQAILGAGPGRLKASKRAIGPFYSKKAKTTFSFAELRFRTIAWVPFINRIDWHETSSPDSLPTPSARHRSTGQRPIDTIYGAGWLSLLSPIPDESRRWFVTPCQTDYLPADVLAAPARASIRAVVELAILGGCDSLQIVRGLPLVGGRGVQLSFRDHPSLGTVAAFDQYVDIDSRLDSGLVRKRDLLFLKGQMSFSGTFHEAHFLDQKVSLDACNQSRAILSELNLRRNREPEGEDRLVFIIMGTAGIRLGLHLGLLTWDPLGHCRGLPFSITQIRLAVFELLYCSHAWLLLDAKFIINTFQRLLAIHSAYVDTIYAAKDGEYRNSRRIEADQTWLSRPSHEFGQNKQEKPLAPANQSAQNQRRRYIAEPSGNFIMLSTTAALNDKRLILDNVALRFCLVWLENPSVLRELAPEEQDTARARLEWQLHDIDIWLRNSGGSRSAECVFQILKSMFGARPVEDHARLSWSDDFGQSTSNLLKQQTKRITKSRREARAQYRMPGGHGQSTRNDVSSRPRSSRLLPEDRTLLNDTNNGSHPYEVEEPGSPERPDPNQTRRLMPPPEKEKGKLQAPEVPLGAVWTRISRLLVNPEALEIRGLPIKVARKDYVVVDQVLTRDEIAELAELTFEIRAGRLAEADENSIRSVSATTGSSSPTRTALVRRQGSFERTRNEEPTLDNHSNSGSCTSSHSGEHASDFPRPATPGATAAMQREWLAVDIGQDSILEETAQDGTPSDQPRGALPDDEEAMADEGMRTLLIYRAILFSILCTLTANTSCVFETELGRRVVQVL